MPKLYDEKPKADELFLRLWQDGGKVELDMVDDNGRWQAVLARIDGNGLHLSVGVDPRCAARAGMADAFDADGRLKVIGGGGETDAEAERMPLCEYGRGLVGALIVNGSSESGAVHFVMTGADGPAKAGLFLGHDDLVDLHARIGRHIAWLKQEGKL